MNANQNKRVEDLFDHLIQLPADRRAEQLVSQCPDDMDVYAEVKRLLDGISSLGSVEDPTFLKQLRGKVDTTQEHGKDPLVGMQIGIYRILEQLGGGGFGTVYKAEQRRPLKRIVALKVIKLGFDTKEIIARFNSERQALARMDHPNIAKVLDAGSTDAGRPYFAMEYVAGVSITRFADENRMSIKDRLLLFLQVCNAVAHAHQKAIIHRDIKASNVLAYARDGRSHAKVIDFGIAKALTSDRLTDLTFNTAQGMTIGTYESMSPEQASGSPDIDTRSDIYSLGVLLYELLAGNPPFDKTTLVKANHAEACRIIRDVEPPRPSSNLNMSGTRATRVAELRQSDANSLCRQLRRELEWIPLKAIRKERERRYRSVQEMAEDIQNYLHGRPLIAGPETRIYRLKKLVSQNASLVGALASIMLVLVLGIAATTVEAVRAKKAQRAAGESEALAVQEAAAKTEAFEKADELLGLAVLESAQLLRDRREYFAAVMTAAYALGFDGDPSGPPGSQTRPLLHRGTPTWNDAVDLSLMPSGRLIWRSRASEQGPTRCICFSHDGLSLASGSSDGSVHIWNVATGASSRTIKCGQSQIAGISFSLDDKTLALVAMDGLTYIRWDLASDRPIKMFHLDNHLGKANARLSFSADGNMLVTVLPDETVYRWNLQTDQPPQILQGPREGVTSVALSPDGNFLAWGLHDNTIQLRDLNATEPSQILQRSSDIITSLVFSSDGRTLASGSRNSTICIWDVNSHQLLQKPPGYKGAVRGVSFSPDGGTLASASDNSTIQLWDVVTGQTLEILRGSPDKLTSVSFSPDGKTLAWAAEDGAIGLWDVQSDKPLQTLVGHSDWISSVSISSDGKKLASASYDKTAELWDLTNEKLIHTFKGGDLPLFSVCFSTDGETIACGSVDGTVRLWDSTNYSLLHVYEENGGIQSSENEYHGILTAQFSSDGKILAAGSRDNLVYLWDVATGNRIQTLNGHTAAVTSVSFSPDNKLLASGSEDKTVRLWDIPSGNPRQILAGHANNVTAVSFSPDGKLLASGSRDSTICLWDFATGRKLSTFQITAGTKITSICFNRDGDKLASGSEDNIIRIWDVQKRMQSQTLHGHMFDVYSVCFSPDGKMLASGSDDDTVKLWAVQSNVPLRQYLAAYRFDGMELKPLSTDSFTNGDGFLAK